MYKWIVYRQDMALCKKTLASLSGLRAVVQCPAAMPAQYSPLLEPLTLILHRSLTLAKT